MNIINSVKESENNFFKCGITGLCLEVLWTGMINFFKKDKKLSCNTSLLMFPIYGMAFLIKPISTLIKKRELCPWDYSKSKFNIKGIIRLDYAPAWFTVGLLYEKILTKH